MIRNRENGLHCSASRAVRTCASCTKSFNGKPKATAHVPAHRRLRLAVKRTSVAALFTCLLLVAPAWGQRKEPPPKDLLEVGITEHLNQQLPLDLPFVDSTGKPATLAQFFDGSKPVLLTLNYSNCPMLCSLQLTGLFDGLKKMDWDLGNQYRMVTVSIDPSETPERAALAKRRYLKQYGRTGSGEGYECLTGRNEQIKPLADAVGFHYRYIPETGEYAHAAATFVCTPDGRLSRYLFGVEYDPQTIRFALLEASEGKIGTPVDQFLLFCFHYDSASGKYGPSAFKLMQLAGVVTVLVVGGVMFLYWRKEGMVQQGVRHRCRNGPKGASHNGA